MNPADETSPRGRPTLDAFRDASAVVALTSCELYNSTAATTTSSAGTFGAEPR